jgi:hypothetical protein
MAGEPLTLEMLAKFHRDVVRPDLVDAIDARLSTFEHRLNGHFATMHERFDRLDALSSEAIAIVKRLEQPKPSRAD